MKDAKDVFDLQIQLNSFQRQENRMEVDISNITELGVDCLDHVFNHIELKDLLSVAQVCRQFRDAATFVYARKYSKRTVEILGDVNEQLEWTNYYDIDERNLVLADRKTILQILRCFGNKITHLEYRCILKDTDPYGQFYEKVCHYINTYCADSLKWMYLDPLKAGFDKLCAKPFKEIETVVLFMRSLDIRSFNRIFPKLKNLNFQWFNSGCKFITIAEEYPHLQSVDVFLNESSEPIKSFVRNILRLNKQLQCLKMRTGPSFYHQMETISLTNIEHFELSDCREIGCTTPDPTPREIPFQFDKLQTFTIANMDVLCVDKYHSFFERHRSIEKLIFASGSNKLLQGHFPGLLAESESLKTLPSLKEICMETRIHYPIDSVVQYMLQFESLKYFSFFCSNSDDIKNFCRDDFKVISEKIPSLLEWNAPTLPFVKLIRNN